MRPKFPCRSPNCLPGRWSWRASAAHQGNPDMVTDAGVGVLMARSAALGALMNVRINLASLKDPSVAESLGSRAEALKKMVLEREQEILENITI